MLNKLLIAFVLSFCIFSSALADVNFIPTTPNINVKSYILVDASNGIVIAEHNSNQKISPASLTKMLTAYIAESQIKNGNLKIDELVTISRKSWLAEGSKMFLEINKTVSVKDILHGIIIQSGNDASIAIAEHIAGSEKNFAEIMNKYAVSFGMKNSYFHNATGLPHKDHYTTAYDLSILSRSIINDFPQQYKIYSQKSFTYNNIKQFNRNKLLWLDSSVDGMKTGHTNESGYSSIVSAKRDKTRLISIVIGAKSDKQRISASKKLLNYGFRYFETYIAFNKAEEIVSAKVWGGEQDSIQLITPKSVYITIMHNQKKKLKTTIKVHKVIEAPLKKGNPYGLITISLNKKVLSTSPLVVKQDVQKANIFKRIWHNIVIFIYKLFNISLN